MVINGNKFLSFSVPKTISSYSSHRVFSLQPSLLLRKALPGATLPMTKAPSTRSSGSSRPMYSLHSELSLALLHQVCDDQKPEAPLIDVRAKCKFCTAHATAAT